MKPAFSDCWHLDRCVVMLKCVL